MRYIRDCVYKRAVPYASHFLMFAVPAQWSAESSQLACQNNRALPRMAAYQGHKIIC